MIINKRIYADEMNWLHHNGFIIIILFHPTGSLEQNPHIPLSRLFHTSFSLHFEQDKSFFGHTVLFYTTRNSGHPNVYGKYFSPPRGIFYKYFIHTSQTRNKIKCMILKKKSDKIIRN